MNRQGCVDFLAGMLAGWLGVNTDKFKRGEREIFDRFGDRVMLAWEFMEEELRELRAK